MNAVIKALHVDPKHAIKIGLGCVLRIAYVRDSGVIYQDADAIIPENFREPGDDLGLISYVAGVGRCNSSSGGDFGGNSFGILGTDVEDVHCGAIAREPM